MSWEEVLKLNLRDKIKEALMLMGNEDFAEGIMDFHLGSGITKKTFKQLIDDIERRIKPTGDVDEDNYKTLLTLKRIYIKNVMSGR
jgi:hypothetical protein|tara:strand:- start:5605 stop:5862 length:258 start_codon:yes stop_codon:yes gene_type:complete